MTRRKKRVWRVRVDVTREVEVFASDAETAQKYAAALGIYKLRRKTRETRITDSVMWVDRMSVGHVEGCRGKHCKHFNCDTETDAPYYCTTCDPGAQ
jgi:hypothetical protein